MHKRAQTVIEVTPARSPRSSGRTTSTRGKRSRAPSHAKPVPDVGQPGPEQAITAVTTGSAELDDMARQIRVCVACPLHKSRTLAVPGSGKASAPVMVIGEGPGASEDKTGEPFVGNAGRYLDHVLEGTGFGRPDLFITNIVKCRPPGNRAPKAGEVDTCTSLYLRHQIELLQPRLVLLLGSTAVKNMLGFGSVEEARGKVHEKDGRRFLASYHPAARFYREDLAGKIKEDFARLRDELKSLKT